MGSLLDKLDKFEEKKDEYQEEKIIPESKKTNIKKEDLHPPKPKTFGNGISFEEIANSSEFKRLVYLIWFGKTHRGKTRELEQELKNRKQKLNTLNDIESKGNYTNVVNEFKRLLAKHNNKSKK